ncbi:unnamed protein product [Mytilus edulis]|uniref:DUF5641 domain-containing protein n=1 Tax=Mytilus edulis TaxID=6550 RepID=A0A8S3TH28_MYTED|nr:unnamed protein product [Mytilus edulis]
MLDTEKILRKMKSTAQLIHGLQIFKMKNSVVKRCNSQTRHMTRIYQDNNLNLDFTEANKRFNHKVTLIEHFAKRWRMEYLTGLREFHRVAGDQSAHVKIGSVVQIMDNSPRMMWNLAVIEDLITGKDGVVRAVKLRTSNGLITTRPIVKLVPLEI